MAVKLGDIVSQAGSDDYRLMNGKDLDITGVDGAHGTLADADMFLVDVNAAGTQASTKSVLASVLKTYTDQTTISGNAATATALATARNIGGVSFDGTASIDLPGVNASGTQNTSGTAAKATAINTTSNGILKTTSSDGTISVGSLVSSDIPNNAADTTGNADTATKIASITNSDIVQLTASQTLTNKTLTTPIIGDMSSCTFPTLNQSTTGNATTATTAATATEVTVTANDSEGADLYPVFVDGASGAQGIETDSALTYNPGANLLTAGSYDGGWVGSTIGIAYGGTGQTTKAAAANALLNVSQGGTLTIGDASDTITIAGDLQVSGATITTTTETLAIADNTLVLNSDLSGTVDVDSGIVVERGGSGDNALLYWDEGNDRWKVGFNDDADLSTSPAIKADVAQIEIDGAYDSGSSSVPIGHFQYHAGSIYVRVAD